MELEKIKITDLNPAEYNPRKISDTELKKLTNSISEFGLVDPIIINLKNNKIIGGHQRYEVLISQYMLDNNFYPELNLIRFGDIGWVFTDTDLTIEDETHEKALNLALNKISGEWDMDLLVPLLDELELTDLDIELTGFDDIELEELKDIELEPPEDIDIEIIEDDYEVNDIETDIKHSDFFKLGNHYLLCGDSTLQKDVEKLINGGGEIIDMVFTDPPWNVNYGDVKQDNPQGYKPRRILNDSMSTDEFKTFMSEVFKNMNAVSKKGCPTYIVMSAQEWGNLMLSLKENDYHWSSTIIWNKNSLVLSRKDYNTKYEPIFYGWKEGAPRLHPVEDKKQTDVWDINRPSRSDEHPTMKPVELIVRALINSSKKNDKILDLFGGSGSTLIACEQTDRNCYMMELEPKYCQVIINRWEEFTGGKAEKIT